MKYVIFWFLILFANNSIAQQKNNISIEYGYYLPSRGAIYGIVYQRKFLQFIKQDFYIGICASYGGKYGASVTPSSNLLAVGEQLSPYSVSHFSLLLNVDLNKNKEKFGLLIGIEPGFKRYIIPRVIESESIFLGQSLTFINEVDKSFCLTPRINPYYGLKINNSVLNVGLYYKVYINNVFGQSIGLSLSANF